MKNKSLLFAIVASFSLVLVLFAAESNKISRITRGIMNQGGTTDLNGSTVVVSDSPTNEFKIVTVTASVSGTSTASSNLFATAFLAAPTVIKAVRSGSTSIAESNVVSTVTSSNLIVSGLSTGAVSTIDFVVYGYQRSGVFQ